MPIKRSGPVMDMNSCIQQLHRVPVGVEAAVHRAAAIDVILRTRHVIWEFKVYAQLQSTLDADPYVTERTVIEHQ